jgi:hypothetical protein
MPVQECLPVGARTVAMSAAVSAMVSVTMKPPAPC